MKKAILMVDVETAGGLDNPLIYDLGLAVYLKGELIVKSSLLIKEIFGNGALMNSAYYANKVPSYLEELAKGQHEAVSFAEGIGIMADMVREYDVEVVSAYNLAFDLRAIANTSKKLLGKEIIFTKLDKLCIWSLACETILQQKTFRKVAEREGWKSPAGNLKTSAEIAYRYITGQYDFVEEHKGLADIEIEAEILARCIRQKKKTKSGILNHPWKLVNVKGA